MEFEQALIFLKSGSMGTICERIEVLQLLGSTVGLVGISSEAVTIRWIDTRYIISRGSFKQE